MGLLAHVRIGHISSTFSISPVTLNPKNHLFNAYKMKFTYILYWGSILQPLSQWEQDQTQNVMKITTVSQHAQFQIFKNLSTHPPINKPLSKKDLWNKLFLKIKIPFSQNISKTSGWNDKNCLCHFSTTVLHNFLQWISHLANNLYAKFQTKCNLKLPIHYTLKFKAWEEECGGWCSWCILMFP